MQIIKNSLDFSIKEDTVVTIGKFDGIHKGHVLILERMKEYRAKGLKTLVLTFDVPPSFMGFGADKDVLMSMEEKEQAFDSIGIDYFVEFPFYEKTAAITAKEFIEDYIVDKLHARAVVVGEDCSFGQGAKGSAEMLKDYGPMYKFEVEILEKLKDNDKEISSTYLRELMREGNVEKVEELSYRPCYITGKIKMASSGISNTLVTYYMDIPKGKVKPKAGVYYSLVLFDDAPYRAISFISSRTDVIETYMYDTVKGLTIGYGSLVLLSRMRDEIICDNDDELNMRVREDIFEGQKWHMENFDKYAKQFATVDC